jgi:predicted DNA-binding transcriptional regulator YafY
VAWSGLRSERTLWAAKGRAKTALTPLELFWICTARCIVAAWKASNGDGGPVGGDITHVPRNDQVVRILTLARALAQSRRGVALKALAERHGWSLRSVYRDLQALEGARFPVVKEGERYRLLDGWTGPSVPGIGREEITALFAARAIAAGVRETSVGRALDRLWMKLTASAGGQTALLPIDGDPWLTIAGPLSIDYRSHQNTIATLERAIHERLVVACRYQALSTQELTFRSVEPGELYWDPRLETLYLIGWCRLRQDVRVFAVHRFLKATLSQEKFVLRSDTRADAVMRNAFRVWRSGNVKQVRIRLSGMAADEVRERRCGPGQRIEHESGNTVVLTLEVAGLPEVQRWVLGFGGEAEVLAPDDLRESVRKAATAIRDRYGHRGGDSEEGRTGPAEPLTLHDNAGS